MSQHGARRFTRRGAVLLASAVVAAGVGAGVAMGASDPAPTPSCSTALSNLHEALVVKKTTANTLLADRNIATEADALVGSRASADTSEDATLVPPETAAVPEAPGEPTDTELAGAKAAAVTAHGNVSADQTADNLAQATVTADQKAADAACQGKPGDPGTNGTNGTNGRDGIDARIVLSPGVCAEAVITPDQTAKLVRVVTLIPCPVQTPPAPPQPPVIGQPVTIITVPQAQTAPAPQIQSNVNLPVTH